MCANAVFLRAFTDNLKRKYYQIVTNTNCLYMVPHRAIWNPNVYNSFLSNLFLNVMPHGSEQKQILLRHF